MNIIYNGNNIALVEFWKMSLDKKRLFEVLLMGLPKEFYGVNHELLTAKLHAYVLDYPSLKFIQS